MKFSIHSTQNICNLAYAIVHILCTYIVRSRYLAPGDDALASDVVVLKTWGMNMIRLHQKVNPQRWYGLVVPSFSPVDCVSTRPRGLQIHSCQTSSRAGSASQRSANCALRQALVGKAHCSV